MDIYTSFQPNPAGGPVIGLVACAGAFVIGWMIFNRKIRFPVRRRPEPPSFERFFFKTWGGLSMAWGGYFGVVTLLGMFGVLGGH